MEICRNGVEALVLVFLNVLFMLFSKGNNFMSRFLKCALFIGIAGLMASAPLHLHAQDWSGVTSAQSRLNFGIDRFEFTSGIIDFHLPIDAALSVVDVLRPVMNPFAQRFQIAYSIAANTLTSHGT